MKLTLKKHYISRNKTNENIRNTMIKMNSEDPYILSRNIINNFNSPRHFLTNSKNSENNNLINSIEKFAKLTKEFSIDDTSKYLMSNYMYSSPNINTPNSTKFEDFMTKTTKNFFKKQKKEVSNIIYKSRKKNISEDITKINFDNNTTEYKNPIDSLGLILNNKCIYDNIMKKFCNKTLKSFGKTLNKFNSVQELKNLNEKKIKITSIIPRALLDEKKKTGIYYDSEEEVANENHLIIPKSCYTNKILILYCKLINLKSIVPESREQFSMDIEILSNNIFLFGGLISNIKDNSLWKFDIFKMKWFKLKKLNNQPELRFGQSGIIIKDKFILFGGKIINKESTYENLAELDIYDIKLNIWYSPFIEKKPILRRNHIACAIGKNMFIHGGINFLGELLSDCYILNIKNLKWNKLDLFYYEKNENDEYDKNKKLYLSYHSCCLVLPNEIINNNKFSIFKMIDLQINKKYYRIREQGLYIFGGKNKESLNDKLFIIKLGKNPLEYKTIEPFGKGPSARILCSMNFFEPGNFIIIHGGKNNFCTLNDTFILEVHRMEWLKVNYDIDNNLIKFRCGHQSVICGNDLIIFGGMDEKNFVGSCLFFINLDPTLYDNVVRRNLIFDNTFMKKELFLKNNNDKSKEKKIQYDKSDKNVFFNDKKLLDNFNFEKIRKLINEQKNYPVKLPKV